MEFDFDFTNKTAHIDDDKIWGFRLGWRYYGVHDYADNYIYPKAITICKEDDNETRFFATVLCSSPAVYTGSNVVNILASATTGNTIFQTIAGYDMSVVNDFPNQKFSFIPPIMISDEKAIFIGNEDFVAQIMNKRANEYVETIDTEASIKQLDPSTPLYLQTISTAGLKKGAPLSGDILYCGTSGNYDYYLFLLKYMWGANEDGNYDWALYSVKIDTSTEGVTYSYITEGYGLFAGLRDLSNKDNTNSYPCLYYSTSTDKWIDNN